MRVGLLDSADLGGARGPPTHANVPTWVRDHLGEYRPSMIDPRSGVPAWRQIADDLRKRIIRGHYAPGVRMPSETDLGHEYGVGRNTVRRAVGELRAEGLVIVQHGWGTRVRPAAESQEILGEPGMIVTARMPTPDERAAHALADGVPMLVITVDGIQFAYPGDATRLRVP